MCLLRYRIRVWRSKEVKKYSKAQSRFGVFSQAKISVQHINAVFFQGVSTFLFFVFFFKVLGAGGIGLGWGDLVRFGWNRQRGGSPIL